MATEYKLQYTASEINERLGRVDNKVDKVNGKGLSSNDFTDEYRAKVDSAFSGDYNDLTNKPSIPSIEGLATEGYVDEAVASMAGAEHNHDDLYYTKSDIDSIAGEAVRLINTKANAVHSHSYNDLTDKPSIPSIEGLATEGYVDEQVEAAKTVIVSVDTDTGKATMTAEEIMAAVTDGHFVIMIVSEVLLPLIAINTEERIVMFSAPINIGGESGIITLGVDVDGNISEVANVLASTQYVDDAIAIIQDGAEIDSFADVESTLSDFATDFEAVITGGSTLETEHKDSIIPAINEIHSEVDAIKDSENIHSFQEVENVVVDIIGVFGDFEALETEHKDTFVGAINEVKNYVDSSISAIPTPDVSGQIDTHNASADAHADIRGAIAANTSAIELLTNGVSAEEVDGVNDLIQYVKEHGGEVTGMKADIKANTDAIAGIKNGEVIDSFADVEAGLDSKLEISSETIYEDITLPNGNDWYSVTYGNGKFVAVAQGSSSAAYSEDGINWVETTMPSNQNWISVTYGNGKFVAVAKNSDKAAYSEDGITWEEANMPSSKNWRSVTYGNGKFVAVVYDSNIAAYSEDGINWVETNMPSVDTWISVTYGNSKFVAISHSNVSAYSEDGITWIETDMPSNNIWHSVTYGNGKFVAVVQSSKTAAYSEDGITWTKTVLPSNQNWRSVTYGNGKFVAVVYNSNVAAYSEDGINWVETTMPSNQNWISVTYGNGKFVAVVHNSDKAAYSEDGINWTSQYEAGEIPILSQNSTDVTDEIKEIIGIDSLATKSELDNTKLELDNKADISHDHEELSSIGNKLEIGSETIYKDVILPSSQKWNSVTYGNGKFVAVAYNFSTAAYSEDGINWVETNMQNYLNWQSVTYGDGKFVAVAYDSSTAAYSEDGINWVETEMPSSQKWYSVTYGNGKFVAVAYNSDKAAYSEDGINWVETNMPSKLDWTPVTYGDGKFVAVASYTGVVAYSEDGVNWTDTTFSSTADWESVTYGNGKFVAVANYSNSAAYSEDGINWVETNMSSSKLSWNSVTYGNGKFVAISSRSSSAAYSEDGINWVETTLPSKQKWYSVTYGNNKFVAVVNGSSTAAYSEDGINWTSQYEAGEVPIITQNNSNVTENTANIIKPYLNLVADLTNEQLSELVALFEGV